MKLKLPFNKDVLIIAFHKPYDISNEQGRALERQRRIALTALTSIIHRVLTMALPLITLSITYNYLNEEVYGLWNAVTTFFSLFAFSDLGLGNGLQTKLSQANGKDDVELCRRIISNTYIILLLVGVSILGIFLIIYPFIDWANFLNAKSSETIVLASSVVFVIVIPRILSIPIAIIQRTQLALQEGYRNNMWGIVGAIFSLVSIIVIAKFDLGKLTLLSVSSLIPVFISLLNLLYFFHIQRKDLRISFRLFDLKIVKSLLSLGILFCLLSVLTTLGLSMDTFIVARTCSLSDAGSYSIIYKITSIFAAVVSIFSAPLWGANGEAIARGDVLWVKKNTLKMSFLLTIISCVLVLVGLCSAKWIFRIWLGETFEFSYFAFFWLCCLKILLSFISPYFMVLNALGKVKIQLLLFAIYTPICFVLKYYLSLKYGIAVIPMVGTILYFLVIVIGSYRASINSLNKLM